MNTRFFTILFVTGLSLLSGLASAQVIARTTNGGSGKRQQLFLEAGGASGTVLSLNYDVRLKPAQAGWGIRAGLGFWPEGAQRIVSVPLQLNYLFGKKQHLLETAAGATIFHSNFAGSTWGIDSNEGMSLIGSFGAAYRYQPFGRGLTARAGATLLVGSFLPVVAPQLSVGYVF